METIIIEFLRSHISEQTTLTDWLAVFIYFCTLVSAITAAVIAKKALDENRKITKAQIEPFIDIKLETVDHHLQLIRLKITNIGKGGAFDLVINLVAHSELNTEQSHKANLVINVFNDRNFMINGLNYLAPLDHKNTSYLNLYGYDKEIVTAEEFFNLKWIATLKYKDFRGKLFEREFLIDASELDEYRVGKAFQEAVPKALEGMQKSIEKISKNIARQTTLLDKKSKSEETHWNEYELKQKLNYMDYVKRRNKELNIDRDEYIFKKIERRPSIQELRKRNK